MSKDNREEYRDQIENLAKKYQLSYCIVKELFVKNPDAVEYDSIVKHVKAQQDKELKSRETCKDIVYDYKCACGEDILEYDAEPYVIEGVYYPIYTGESYC